MTAGVDVLNGFSEAIRCKLPGQRFGTSASPNYPLISNALRGEDADFHGHYIHFRENIKFETYPSLVKRSISQEYVRFTASPS